MRVLGLNLGELPRNDSDADGSVSSSSELAALLRHGLNEDVWANVAVSPAHALTISTVYACVRVIAEDIGKSPHITYETEYDSERNVVLRQPAIDDPLYKLLRWAPNPQQTAQRFREMVTGHAVLRGDGYAFINWVGIPRLQHVAELVPIHPGRVEIKVLPDLTVEYKVAQRQNAPVTYSQDQMLHLMDLSDDGYRGIGVVTKARQTMGVARAAQRHGGRHFGGGARPAGALKLPGTLSEEAQKRLAKQFDADHGGENVLSTMVLEEGLEFQEIGMTNEDSQFLETREFERAEIAAWFRVPPHMVGDLRRATFSNIENQGIQYVNQTLSTWTERWSQELQRKVFLDSTTLHSEISLDALLRGDTKTRYAALQIAINAGFMSRNEARIEIGLNPVDGLDEMLVPLNIGAADDDDGSDEDSESKPERDDDDGQAA